PGMFACSLELHWKNIRSMMINPKKGKGLMSRFSTSGFIYHFCFKILVKSYLYARYHEYPKKLYANTNRQPQIKDNSTSLYNYFNICSFGINYFFKHSKITYKFYELHSKSALFFFQTPFLCLQKT